MTTTGHTAEYRVDLDKHPAEYLVIADHIRTGRAIERKVLHVERRPAHPLARRAQWEELTGVCLDDAGELSLLAYTAVSHAHAAHLARREYAAARAVSRMGDEIYRHLERGDRGWIAIRIADGSSDGELYGDYEDAFAAQERPEEFTYFPISPLFLWTPQMCEEHLEAMTHLRHGCMVHGRPTCN